eukprot:3551227-Prymnesium_polylepis.1
MCKRRAMRSGGDDAAAIGCGGGGVAAGRAAPCRERSAGPGSPGAAPRGALWDDRMGVRCCAVCNRGRGGPAQPERSDAEQRLVLGVGLGQRRVGRGGAAARAGEWRSICCTWRGCDARAMQKKSCETARRLVSLSVCGHVWG